ncbi:UDP-glucose dehydrogenase family protein [Pseudalkalibacillus caeni]|uniref:UDP-glucose 6-dehydrogenase n=1 Tax=Exobacillus caeni TaxID=2574798 RepID=A0A5R9F1G7_9BACL|nr:UDP-glucose/GDP-mannose dehydrogenase family protein [Pseudalkalibacillus caeni]TLS37482.1 UDP-glucose/GDP-mannose dehydrogenase family protein [Pseudalkalibacillus caeni]
MNICVIGAGYVGLTTAAVLSDLGHHVTCVDINHNRIDMLKNGVVPIFEPGLKEMIIKNTSNNHLTFSTDVKVSIAENPFIFITVGTPSSGDGIPNLSFVHSVIDDIATSITSYKIIIVKSTVPPGTNEEIVNMLIEKGVDPTLFDIVSNPEFLREGSAVKDMLEPDKIVIGVKKPELIQLIQKIYKEINAPYIVTNLTGAEMIKYAANAFLATKISFINEIARVCDAYNVNVKDVAFGIGLDPRIGPLFLQAGMGYGGSCFPKDLQGLTYAAKKKNLNPELISSVQKVNETQIDVYVNKLKTAVPSLEGKKITVWGLSFKPGTDDIRHSASIRLIERLLEEGVSINTYDPVVQLKKPEIKCYQNIYESVKQSYILIIATEWAEFNQVNWKKVKNEMEGNILLDGRNIIDPKTVQQAGFHYLGVGQH